MKKYALIYALSMLLLSLMLVLAATALGVLEKPKPIQTSDVAAEDEIKTVIIDAGHGGEDGGTSSKSGLVEKDINLELALTLKALLEDKGVNVILTRDSDTLLYDRNADYRGQKKKLDMAARLEIIQNTKNCIFVSLHMNAYTDPKYSGLQVWYSENNADSALLADKIQSNVKTTLQPSNNRKTKPAGDSIYLLKNSYCPAVLVECGFLSNVAEAKLFESKEYKSSLCSCLANSINEYIISKNAQEKSLNVFHGYTLGGSHMTDIRSPLTG